MFVEEKAEKVSRQTEAYNSSLQLASRPLEGVETQRIHPPLVRLEVEWN